MRSSIATVVVPAALRIAAFVTVAAVAGGQTPAPAAAPPPHPITFEDFSAVRAVSDPHLSPDGKALLYAVRVTDVDANRRVTTTWRRALADSVAVAFPDDSTHASEARWSPDGKWIAFVAGGQLWIADPTGVSRRQLTRLSGGASGPVWAPTSDRIAFVSSVYPDCGTDACNGQRDDSVMKSQVHAHIADQLMYRHWNRWDDGTRSHLFVVATTGAPPKDLVPGARYDVPPGPFAGSEGYAWSPDGRELAYSAKDQGRADAWSTDVNLYVVPAAGGASDVITGANRGADENPVYSPDGKFIAYQSQATPGYESDRWRLMLYDRATKRARELFPRWDRNADWYAFGPRGRTLWVGTIDFGREKLFRSALGEGGAWSMPEPVIAAQNNVAFSFSDDGQTVAWVRDAANHPGQVWAASLDGHGASDLRAVTHENDALLATLKLYGLAEFRFAGAGGDSVQGWILKPPQWEPGKKTPAILLIHGGPQGAWLDQWHSRWNYQMFAAAGEALIIINPRGSYGYGQRFVAGVSGDWGGKPYHDLMLGLDAALRRYPWIDRERLGAAGGSYGGYMVNWIAGHTDRFKALVSHAGPYNLEAMYATEELWFADKEFSGPYWDPSALKAQYRVFSPHLYAKNFRTPTLVLNGEQDFRVPYTEGLSLFNALQRRGVPSRLVVFPDEGHWIQKPQNARLWWSEVQEWMTRYLGPNGPKASRPGDGTRRRVGGR
jgi:dipeptidyl aminopeptidase/acylaminoacyl peptidase